MDHSTGAEDLIFMNSKSLEGKKKNMYLMENTKC